MAKTTKKGKGRPAVDYQTVQVRAEKESWATLSILADLQGQTVAAYMRSWLLPLASRELNRLLQERGGG